jgi:carboxyl-terminal processing protease
MASSRRSLFIIPLTIVGCAVLAGIIVPNLEEVNAATADTDIDQATKSFTGVYALVESNFADRVSPDKALYNGAIPGMLRTLDPHSNFFDPKSYAAMREDQRGRYYGVGMMIGPQGQHQVVIAPTPGAPAYKAGLRPGDVILEVNDKSCEGLNTSEVADILRGARGTKATIKVRREGVTNPLTFEVMRDEIPKKTVHEAHFVKPGLAYVDVESFSSETTSKELEEQLAKLGEKNIKGLILDLRDNPGGLLTEGVSMADLFLQRGQKIVSHRGRSSPEKRYLAQRGNRGNEYPIVVLVSRTSASAAEIVSGALQDHDRAWILGDNTFGKGLVQTVYPLNENTALALTTAKYYTPSDRLIQRDYSHTSFVDYYYRKNTETKNLQDVKMTDAGRTVYGGGGIAPDEKFVPPDYNKFQIRVLRRQAFFKFSGGFFGAKENKLPANWEPDQQVLNDFHQFLLNKEKIEFTEAEWAENSDWIKQQVRLEIYKVAFGTDESRKIAADADPVVQKAVESMPKAKQLLENAKKLIVQRMAGGETQVAAAKAAKD